MIQTQTSLNHQKILFHPSSYLTPKFLDQDSLEYLNDDDEEYDHKHSIHPDHISFKKIQELPRPSTQARFVCLIPEKSLLLILLQDGTTVKIYNTINFKLLAVKKASEEVICMSYCPKLGKLMVGGFDEFLQLWSPKAFQVESECFQRNDYHTIQNVTYVSKSDVIVTMLDNQIRFYSQGLRYMTSINVPVYSGHWYPKNAEIMRLSKNLFLTVCIDRNQKVPVLVNLKRDCCVEFSRQVFIPFLSCVEMTENAPINVFSCLGMFNSKPSRPEDERNVYQLIQFSIDPKTEELVPVRRNNPSTTYSFRKLHKVENSKYFLSEKFEKDVSSTCLLSFEKNQIEILRVISNPSLICLNKVNIYIMSKGGKTIIEANGERISVYRSVVYCEK